VDVLGPLRAGPAGHAFHLDAEAVERRDEFGLDREDDEAPAVEEITPDHWAWRGAHGDYIERSLKQNVAAISGEFHTHRLYWPFYERFGEMVDGFIGQYELCIAMAEALTAWELANGVGQAYESAGVPRIELVEDIVETVLETAVDTGDLPDPVLVLPTIQVLAGRAS
jgi:hypothetical protein